MAMKTTIDIADPVLEEAKTLAAKEGTTLRALVEDGLRRVLIERKQRKTKPFKPVVFGGEGLTPEFKDKSWAEIIEASYEGRGGDRR